MAAPFVPGGPSHLVVLTLTFGVPLVFAAATRRAIPGLRILIRGLLAALLIGAEILWLWLVLARGWASPQTLLPLQLCDWASIAALVTLIRPNRTSYELVYFWALCGSLQGLLTPDLAVDYPDPRFVVFFAQHGGVIAASLYLTFGLGMRPVPASIPRVLAWTLAYVFAAGTADVLLGTNFGFLAAKPEQASLLSLLGPWPIYILELVPIGLFLVALFYLPFFLFDRLKQPAIVSEGAKR